jgi:hypothetical protein
MVRIDMSDTGIPKLLRDRVAAQAHHRCGDRLATAAIVGTPTKEPS